jgi:hypothetical protein
MPTMNEGGADAQQRSMPPNEALHTMQDGAKASTLRENKAPSIWKNIGNVRQMRSRT